jgi:hypothetical protein
VRKQAADFTVPNLKSNSGMSGLGHSARAQYRFASKLQTIPNKVMGALLPASTSDGDTEFVGQVFKKASSVWRHDAWAGTPPINSCIATGWDRSIFHRADGVVEAKIPAGENDDTLRMDGIRSNPALINSCRKAYAGMTVSESNWLQWST